MYWGQHNQGSTFIYILKNLTSFDFILSVLLDHICFSVYFMQQNELLLIRLKIHHLFECNTTPF